MMRRAVAASVLLAVALGLTGCNVQTRETCEADGGQWVERSVLVPVLIGRTTTLQPRIIHVCEGQVR